MIGDWVSVKIAQHLNLKEKSNWSAAVLQNVRHVSVIEVTLVGRKRKKQMKKDGNFTKPRKVSPSKRCTRKEWS